MQPQQKALPGKYYAKLIGCIVLCILTFAMLCIEIFDSLHLMPITIDMVPINTATHLARIIFIGLAFICSCVLFSYGMRVERAKALRMALDVPRWFLFLDQWPLKWTLKNAVSFFLLWFTGAVIFHMLFPATAPLDRAWIVLSASLYASLLTFVRWIGHRRRVKPEIFVR